MKRNLWAVTLAATPVSAEPVLVPSGQPISLVEVIENAPGTTEATYRFRFMAPAISREGGVIDTATALADMEALCQDVALPWLQSRDSQTGQVIISLSDRPVTFGDAAPEATQFFEAYRVENGVCVWEEF